MKFNFIRFWYSLLVIAYVSAGCNDQVYREVNTNKEAFSSVDYNLLLPNIQASLSGGRFEQWRANLIYGEAFIQHLAGAWSTSNFGVFFRHNTGYETALWNTNYFSKGIVRDLITAQENIKDNPSLANLEAVFKIVKVMVFQRLTDTYGDVPFSEAGLGFYKKIYRPKYDTQESIYDNFFELLNEASEGLSKSRPDAGRITNDNFYDGDISKWKKLANSLRLRCAMRISMIDKAKAKYQIELALSGGVFESNKDNCFTHHDATAFNVVGAENNGNGMSHGLKGAGAVYDHPTEILLEKLNNDPRKQIWFAPGLSGSMEGLDPNKFAYEHPGGSNALAILQPYLYKNDAPYLHISYSEVSLLLAEAAQRGLISGDAQDYYQKGIEAGILQWAAFGAEVDTGTAKTFAKSKTLDPGKEIEEINTQQWLTLFMNGMEAYANQRRTDFPTLTPITRVDSNTGGVMPKRIPYPIGESTANADNYKEAKAKYPNGWLSRVWWDVK